MDAYPNVNAFLARFFVNKGQTSERWMLKQHALAAFYRALSHWSIFMTNPSTYGWTDHADDIPPIHVHEHHVPLTDEQTEILHSYDRQLFVAKTGGITKRATLSQIAKGTYEGKDIATNKPAYIRDLLAQWPDESTLVWCRFNREQDTLDQALPNALSIRGATPIEEREELLHQFKTTPGSVMVSKPKVLGFGLNLQNVTRQVFSSCEDSYESYYQAVKRSNRVGSTKPLHVHLPTTDIEYDQMENVLRKARRVTEDAECQERLFKQHYAG